MLKKIGVNQIFLPKKIPADPSFRSASIDYSEDKNLDIPVEDLNILNAADWYGGGDAEAWSVANKYFDLVFMIIHQAGMLANIARYFNGAVIWRAYGLDKSVSYDAIAKVYNESHHLRSIGRRFYFGEAYAHLSDIEPDYLKRRRIYLPLGMNNVTLRDVWQGGEAQIYFVCPDIGFSPYYKRIYDDFTRNFSGFKYVIAGAQPVQVDDPRVLGDVSDEQHAHNINQSRVMFYHSREPNHIHYHPFEAIRAGMPLVFMAGGMLDRMGGKALPGRCKTEIEAHHKIQKILAGDRRLIESIRASQVALLEPMKPENCEQAWRDGFARIETGLKTWRLEQTVRPQWLINKRKRLAVVLPVGYRGGSLRGAIELTKALHLGSRKAGDDADIVFMHLDDPSLYREEDFSDLPETIVRRPFRWKVLSQSEAQRAMYYAGFTEWIPTANNYQIPDDGLQQLSDCDACLIVSDRLNFPILPIKPVVVMVYDYIQRYEPKIMVRDGDKGFLAAVRAADRVLVTTDFTRQDVLQYAGLEASRVRKVPMLIPNFSSPCNSAGNNKSKNPYFLWQTNAGAHKNHENAASALRMYYEEMDGLWDCKVTGVNTEKILHSKLPHLQSLSKVFERSAILRKRVKWLGELPNGQYKKVLAGAEFLWHAAQVDNGTFSVAEAAWVGVPALSSDYPAMREMNAQFGLNILWMDPTSPTEMAKMLKKMEYEAALCRTMLPCEEKMRMHNTEHHANAYWRELREIL